MNFEIEVWFGNKKLMPDDLAREFDNEIDRAIAVSVVSQLRVLVKQRLATLYCPEHPDAKRCKIVLSGCTLEDVLKRNSRSAMGCCTGFQDAVLAALRGEPPPTNHAKGV